MTTHINANDFFRLPKTTDYLNLTVYQVRQWILYRQQETLDEQKAYRHITRALQDAITGKAIVTSSWVDALLHLLPAHYLPHLTLTNRYDRDRCETCACFKTNPRGKFWSALRFDTEDVLAVWPPPAGREQQQALRQRELRPAPDSMIHNTISKVYDEAEREDLKPPNVKEIVAPVQKRLSVQGYEASGRQIQQLAEADEHKSRRRRPGPTVMSEKRRQLR